MSETITAYYAKDHDRLDVLFTTFQETKRSDFPKAKAAFVQFLFGLKRHIIWEEDILFPVFEKKTGMRESGPTAVMRMEHRQIKKELDAIHEKVAAGSPDSDAAEQRLLAVLSTHNHKEENILYPGIDRLINDAEAIQVFQKMKEIPSERYEICC